MTTVTITRVWHYGNDRRVDTFEAPTLAAALDAARADLPDRLYDEAFAALASERAYYDGWSWFHFSAKWNDDEEEATSEDEYAYRVEYSGPNLDPVLVAYKEEGGK